MRVPMERRGPRHPRPAALRYSSRWGRQHHATRCIQRGTPAVPERRQTGAGSPDVCCIRHAEARPNAAAHHSGSSSVYAAGAAQSVRFRKPAVVTAGVRGCRRSHSISPTDCCDETSRLSIARRFGSAMISNTDSTLLVYSSEHMLIKVYNKKTEPRRRFRPACGDRPSDAFLAGAIQRVARSGRFRLAASFLRSARQLHQPYGPTGLIARENQSSTANRPSSGPTAAACAPIFSKREKCPSPRPSIFALL
jgi:hypothetical protein